MTAADYQNQRDHLETKFDKEIEALNWKYVRENAEFKVGDFIQNVTGIIKIEQILYEDHPDFNQYIKKDKIPCWGCTIKN